jgi:hypothetical protein
VSGRTPPPDAAGETSRWALLVLSLPVDDAAGRMRVLRMLETLGAGIGRDGV